MVRTRGRNYAKELAKAIKDAGMASDLPAVAEQIGVHRHTLAKWLKPETYPKLTCPKWAYDLFVAKHRNHKLSRGEKPNL